MPRLIQTLSGLIKSPEDVKEQYRDASNLNARAAIYRFAVSGASWPRWVFEQMSPRDDARILEIGCGNGGLWKANADRIPAGWRIVLSNLSPGMIDELRRQLALPHRGIRFTLADAQQLPFAAASFDAVIANHMLYHVPDLPATLAEIRRVLAPEGKLFATTNSNEHLRRMKELIYEFLGNDSPLAGVTPFSLESATQLLRPHFREIEQRATDGELRVTDPQAIVSYVMSIHTAPQRITGQRYEELCSIAQREVGKNGAFVIATHSGMLIAGV